MGVWFHRQKKGRKRPAWATQSMWEEMTGTFTTRLFGYSYDFPINKHTEPIVRLLEGALDPWLPGDRRSEFKRTNKVERGFQDIVNALLIQVRDTTVAEAAGLIAQDIKHKLEPLIERKLHENVERLTLERPAPKDTVENQKETPP